jgi:hypothetical protein
MTIRCQHQAERLALTPGRLGVCESLFQFDHLHLFRRNGQQGLLLTNQTVHVELDQVSTVSHFTAHLFPHAFALLLHPSNLSVLAFDGFLGITGVLQLRL